MSPLRVLVVLFSMSILDTAAAPLFEDETVVEATLVGPIESTVDRKTEREERPFTLTADGVDHAVEIRVRGKSRIRVCVFPPLRLDFEKGASEGTLFADQDKLRLVTHCRDSDRSEQDLLEEYAAYRILNRITEFSYRVRLLRLRYVDAGSSEDAVERFGFVVESDRELAERTGSAPVRLEGVRLGALDAEHAAAVYIFEYLIGNTDWSLVTADGDEFCCHNGNLFERGERLYYVPYDFDLAGLVNARYAFPDPSLRIKTVTKRRYRGYCTSPDALRAALATIVERRESILDVLRGLPSLPPKQIDSKVRYLERFFTEAEDADKLLTRFERRCL